MDRIRNLSEVANTSEMVNASGDFYMSVMKEEDGSFHKPQLILLCVIFISTQIMGNLMLSSIIWYEMHRDRDRSLLQHLHCLIFSFLLFHNAVPFSLVIFRWVIGPYPEPLCSLIGVLMASCHFGVCLTSVQIVILRYLYVFRWKHTGVVFDDFFITFLNFLNPVLGLFFGTTLYAANVMMNSDHAVCSGLDPDFVAKKYPESPIFKNPGPDLAILLIALTLFLAFEVRIFVYKKKSQVVQVRSTTCLWGSEPLKDLRSTLASLITFFIVGVLPGIVIRALLTYDEQREYPGSLLFLCAYFGPHFTVAFVIPSLVLARKQKMRRGIIKKLLELFCDVPYLVNY